MRNFKKTRLRAWIWFGAVFLVAGGLARCGPVGRLEPAVGDRPEMVDRITGAWKEAETLAEVRKLAAAFVRAWKNGEHEAAWALLSPPWRSRYEAIAGERDAAAIFAKSRVPRAEGEEPWDPVVTLFGERLMYMSLPSQEMGVKETPGRLLVYAVQDDGTWRAFRAVTLAGTLYLEPIGVLE